MFAGTDYAALLLNFHPLAILSTKLLCSSILTLLGSGHQKPASK
jgi:hypothetical protein